MHPVNDAAQSLVVYAGQLVGNFDGELIVTRHPHGRLFGFRDIEFVMSNSKGKILGDTRLLHFTSYSGTKFTGYYRGWVTSGTGSYAHMHASGLRFVSTQNGAEISISIEGTLAY